MGDWHTLTEKEVFEKLNVKDSGLTKSEAKTRLEKYGKNELLEKKQLPTIFLFFKQFHSVLIYILVVAAVISYFFGEVIDVYVIAAVILINATIGFVQENKAEHSIKALRKLVVSYAKVYRDNELEKIPAIKLVPGDIIVLEEGDRVPADCRLIKIKNLRTNESSLTGESFPADKELKIFPIKTILADRKNMIHMGTFVASGSCKAIVVDTGQKTTIGSIAKDIEKIPKTKTHFQKKADFLGKQMAIIAVIGAGITFLIGFFIRGFEFTEVFITAIAVLVSAIPEGLPAVLAIVLAIGAFRMSKKNALIRRLPATETLGVVTTILTDKTGTLTENTMNVETISIPGYEDISVSGNGWEPKGEFKKNNKTIVPLENEHLKKLLHISAICNNSRLIKDKNSKEQYKIIGDPTEAALLVLAKKAGINRQALAQSKLDDLPFNPEFKYRASLSTLIKDKTSKQVYVVGAPESVLLISSHMLRKNTKRRITDKYEKEINTKINELTRKGMRVLGLAYKNVDKNVTNLTEKLVDETVFVGLVGIRDPPRPEVKGAIEKAKKSGIRVLMATGDHKETALSIAKEIKLVDSNNAKALTGKELDKLSKAEFRKAVKEVSVFARLTPHMKLRIVEELQAQKQIVAVTGDGVNDAPALRKADIGISMGVIGTDVARESSEIVLADDNFASIIDAIEEGRIVFTNTRQASSFLVTTNVAEVATIVAAISIGLPLPLLPTQILWLNLVTDGVNDVALAAEPGHNHSLNHPPRNYKENILNKEVIPFLILMSLIMVVATLFIFYSYLGQSLEKARTGAFVVMAFTQLFNVFNMRDMKQSVFKIGLFSNKYIIASIIASVVFVIGVLYLPFFQNIFQFIPLTIYEFLSIVAISSLVLIAGEGYKYIKKPKK